jgi:predicted DNA-binding transcriptional regulator AlpA
MNPNTPEPYLTADQLAPLLSVSLDWIYERAKAGDLPSYIQPGGRRGGRTTSSPGSFVRRQCGPASEVCDFKIFVTRLPC